jgi:threonine dehydrogenase-like Zn-dependent dehydrogenase
VKLAAEAHNSCDPEPIACVVRAARETRISCGQAAVLGAGSIGNLHILMLRSIGVTPIIVAETSTLRSELAHEAGADVVVSDTTKIKETVFAHTGGCGADVVVESVGTPELYSLAFQLIRSKGKVAVFGLTGSAAILHTPIPEIALREKPLKRSVARTSEDMRDALKLLRQNRFKLSAFIRKTIRSPTFRWHSKHKRPSSAEDSDCFACTDEGAPSGQLSEEQNRCRG